MSGPSPLTTSSLTVVDMAEKKEQRTILLQQKNKELERALEAILREADLSHFFHTLQEELAELLCRYDQVLETLS